TLNPDDQEYLRNWFSEQALCDLDRIASAILTLPVSATVKDLMRLALSNILRSVSWQKDDDLRVRKQVKPDADIDPISEFLEELQRSVKAVLSLRYYQRTAPVGTFDIQEGDAR